MTGVFNNNHVHSRLSYYSQFWCRHQRRLSVTVTSTYSQPCYVSSWTVKEPSPTVSSTQSQACTVNIGTGTVYSTHQSHPQVPSLSTVRPASPRTVTENLPRQSTSSTVRPLKVSAGTVTRTVYLRQSPLFTVTPCTVTRNFSMTVNFTNIQTYYSLVTNSQRWYSHSLYQSKEASHQGAF